MSPRHELTSLFHKIGSALLRRILALGSKVILGSVQESKQFFFMRRLESLSRAYIAHSNLDSGRRTIRFKYILDRFVRREIRSKRMPFSLKPDERNVRYSINPDAFFGLFLNAVVTKNRADGLRKINPHLVAGASWKRYKPLNPKRATDILEELNKSARSESNRCTVYHYHFGPTDFYTAFEGKNRVRWFQIYGGMLSCTVNEQEMSGLMLARDLIGNLYVRSQYGRFEFVPFPAVFLPLLESLTAEMRPAPLLRIGYFDRIRTYQALFYNICAN